MPYRHPVVVGFAVVGMLLSVLLSGLYFHFSYFEPDTVSYSFQAKLFARGRLSLPAPPLFGFSSSPHINILNGKWYSKYPFGNALMLAPGEWIHAPWLIPALATGLMLMLLYGIVRDVYGQWEAWIATILGLISPAALGMGCTWFSESVSRLYLAFFLLGLFRLLRGGGWRYALFSGFALGYAFNTRPMPAIAFGLAGGGLALYQLVRARAGQRTALLRVLLIFLLPFMAMMLVCGIWNAYFTGNPLQFTHNAAQPYDRIGFGQRTEGYEPDLEGAFVFTPAWAIERIWRHTLPGISYNALGWGHYRPQSIQSVIEHPLSGRTFLVFLLLLPLLLMLLPLVHHSRNRYDVFFLSLLVLQLALYFPFYFEGTTWGWSPVNARYYNECTLLGIVPLIARGITLVWDWTGNHRRRRIWQGMLVIAALLLTVNTVVTYVQLATPYRNWGAVYQKLPRLVKQQGLKHAVVFIPNHRGAPIGDYPFEPLEEANIIYFKLGPAPRWRLNESDPHALYQQYFQGRSAYLYKDGRLQRIQPR